MAIPENLTDLYREYDLEIHQLKEPPLVSIVILSYNDLPYLKNLLDDIFKKTIYPNFEIIIIDNGTTDEVHSWIKDNIDKYPRTRYYKLPKNIGFGKGMNIGIKKAGGKYVACCNTDIILTEKWLKYMVYAAENIENAGLIGCNNIFSEYSHVNYSIPSELYYYKTISLGFAVFLAKKELIGEDGVGLFDRFFFLYFEDIDLIYRFILKGYTNIIQTSSFVFHGSYLDKSNKGHMEKKRIKTVFDTKRSAYIWNKSKYYFILKWHTIPSILKELIFFLFELLYSAITLNKGKTLGKLKAIKELLMNLDYIIAVRRDLRKIPNFKEKMGAIRKWERYYQINRRKILLIQIKHIFPKIYSKLKTIYS